MCRSKRSRLFESEEVVNGGGICKPVVRRDSLAVSAKFSARAKDLIAEAGGRFTAGWVEICQSNREGCEDE